MKKIIVVGAGILGSSAAYHLTKYAASGEVEVTLVDGRHPGRATDAAAGIICPWLSQRRNQTWYRLAKAGARYYPRLTEMLHADGESETGYARVGAISLHTDASKIEQMRERAEKRKADAPEIGDIEVLDEEQVRALFPLLGEGYQAVRVSGAARVDGAALRDAMIAASVRRGAILCEGEAVLLSENGRVTGVTVDGETLRGDEVIVCAGAWAAELLKPLGLNFLVTYQKGQILHLQSPDRPDSGTWPVVIPPTDQYLLAFDNGKMVAGATHENDVERSDIRVTAGGVHEVLSKGLELALGLSNCELEEVRVGFRPFTPGFLPVIGRVPSWEGLIAANGLGASGLTMGPFLGSQLAKLALGQEPDIPLEDYHLNDVITDF